MSKYFKKGSVPFKIFACFISVVLVLGCAFIPGKKAYAVHSYSPANPGEKIPDEGEGDDNTGDGGSGGGGEETNNDMELLLDPSAHGYDDWFTLENEDPYGNKEDEAFMLMEQNEVFSLQHYNKDDINEICSMYGDYTAGSTGKFGSAFKSDDKAAESGIPSDIMWTDAIQTVAFSPSPDFPQKDHIAVIGFIWDNKNKQVRLWVYNARDNKWSDAKTIGNLSWADVDGTSFYGDLEPYMSITAGDYNGDHRDSVVTYFGDCNSSDYGITEWAISDGPDGKPSINQASKDSKFSLLNKAYAAGGVDDMKKIYDSTDHQAAGKGSLHLILKTGDFDGDGVDDVAALSSLEFYKSDHAKQYDWRLNIPYLAICQGKNNGSFLNGDTYYGAYVGNYDEGTKTADTVNIANFAVARLWKHGADAIIIGGASFHFEGGSDDKLKSTSHTNDLKMARYDLIEKKDDKGNIISEDFGLFSFVNQCYDSYSSSTNPPLKNMSVHDYSLKCNYEKNYAWNPICAQAVYMNGKGNDPYILMDGDLYHWKKGSTYPQKVFDYSGMDGDNYEHFAQHFCPLACTCAGSWDGNDQGFEQVVFGMCSRQGGTDQDDDDYRVAFITIGISPEKHDSLTALPTGVTQKAELPYDVGYSSSLFFSTAENGKNHDEDYTINDKGSTSGHGLNFALCNMDYRDDGLTAKYKGQNIIYSDPVVQYILQAAPYWEEEVGSAAGETSIKKEFRLEREVSASNEITEDDGFSVGGSFGGKRWGIGANLKCGSTQGFAKKYSGKMGTKRTLQTFAKADTVVAVSRYPFYYYNYETYDPETNDWKQDMCVTSLAWQHILTVSLTPEWYNKFVDEYNESYKQICIDNQELYKGLSPADQEKYKIFGNKLLSQPESELVKLDTVQDADLFNCDGHPQYYKRVVNGGVGDDGSGKVKVKTVTGTITVTGAGDVPEYYWDVGGSNTWESSRGLHFGYDLNLDFHNDTSKRHQRHTWSFNVGIYSDFGQMWGIGTTNSLGFTAGYSFKVQPPTKDPISCEGGYWNSSLPVNPLNNNSADANNWIPVIGYVVNLLNFSDSEPEIPNVTEKTFDEAKADLVQAGYKVAANPIYECSTINKDKVTRTDPAAGTQKPKGTTVQVYVSKGDIVAPGSPEVNEGTTPTKGNELNILDSFIGPKLAYADENNFINISWDTGDNSSDCTYQVYTSINGEVYKVGKPVKGSEFQIDLENPSDDMKDVVEKLKNQDLPIYQFAISVINENGIESPMSGWVYFCSSKYFKETMSCYVSRNQARSKNRLNLLIKHNGRDAVSKVADSIGLKRDTGFVCSRWKGKSEITDLAFKDSFPYRIEDFKFLKTVGRDCLYQVQLVNKTNSDDVKNCVMRLDDGKDPSQRLLEAEILSNWSTPTEITNAINNPQTHDEAEAKLLEVYNKIATTHDLKITGDAKEVYTAGVKAYNHYYGYDDEVNPAPFVIAIVGLCVLLAIGIGLYFFLKKRKTAQAVISTKTTEKKTTAKTTTKSNLKSKSNSKYGVY